MWKDQAVWTLDAAGIAKFTIELLARTLDMCVASGIGKDWATWTLDVYKASGIIIRSGSMVIGRNRHGID